MPKKTFKGKTRFRTFALGSTEDTFDFQIKFDIYQRQPYVEIVPISRRYGKIIKNRAIRFYNDKAFNNFVKAINELNTWIEERTEYHSLDDKKWVNRSPWTAFRSPYDA